jgi:Phage integrase, N-terminal SAM-like domain
MESVASSPQGQTCPDTCPSLVSQGPETAKVKDRRLEIHLVVTAGVSPRTATKAGVKANCSLSRHSEARRRGQESGRDKAPSGRAVSASTTFPTRADANRWLALAEADLARGEWSDRRLGQTTLAEWADRWLETTVDLKPKTQDWYETMLRTHVLPTLGSIPVARIDQAGLQAFAADLNRSGAPPGQ